MHWAAIKVLCVVSVYHSDFIYISTVQWDTLSLWRVISYYLLRFCCFYCVRPSVTSSLDTILIIKLAFRLDEDLSILRHFWVAILRLKRVQRASTLSPEVTHPVLLSLVDIWTVMWNRALPISSNCSSKEAVMSIVTAKHPPLLCTRLLPAEKELWSKYCSKQKPMWCWPIIRVKPLWI